MAGRGGGQVEDWEFGIFRLARHDPVAPHHVLFFVALAAQVVALALGRRALAASDRRAAALEALAASPIPPAGTPDAA